MRIGVGIDRPGVTPGLLLPITTIQRDFLYAGSPKSSTRMPTSTDAQADMEHIGLE